MPGDLSHVHVHTAAWLALQSIYLLWELHPAENVVDLPVLVRRDELGGITDRDPLDRHERTWRQHAADVDDAVDAHLRTSSGRCWGVCLDVRSAWAVPLGHVIEPQSSGTRARAAAQTENMRSRTSRPGPSRKSSGRPVRSRVIVNVRFLPVLTLLVGLVVIVAVGQLVVIVLVRVPPSGLPGFWRAASANSRSAPSESSRSSARTKAWTVRKTNSRWSSDR